MVNSLKRQHQRGRRYGKNDKTSGAEIDKNGKSGKTDKCVKIVKSVKWQKVKPTGAPKVKMSKQAGGSIRMAKMAKPTSALKW